MRGRAIIYSGQGSSKAQKKAQNKKRCEHIKSGRTKRKKERQVDAKGRVNCFPVFLARGKKERAAGAGREAQKSHREEKGFTGKGIASPWAGTILKE